MAHHPLCLHAAEEKALRASCQNNMVIATMMMLDPENMLRLRAVVKATESQQQWHVDQSKTLRNVTANAAWLMNQAKGDFLQSLATAFQIMSRPGDLQWVGLQVHMSEDTDRVAIECEDNAAELVPTLTLCMIAVRMRRCCWLFRGWPSRTCLLLDSEDSVVMATLLSFQQDRENFKELQRQQDNGGWEAAGKIIDRSIFQLLPVQQDLAILDHCGWSMTPKAKQHFTQVHRRVLGSQVCEDGFKRQKASKKTGANHKGKVQRAFGALLKRHVLGGVHGYDEVKQAACAPVRAASLPPEAYKAKAGCCTLPLHKVISHEASASWYSPSADRHSVMYVCRPGPDQACPGTQFSRQPLQCLAGVPGGCKALHAGQRQEEGATRPMVFCLAACP